MYHGNENMLAQFCLAHKVDFVVFDKGDGFGKLHKFSLPYMAAAMKVNKQAPAYLMKNQPGALKYFYRLTPPADCKVVNNRYEVFRFISSGSHAKARKFADLAMYYYKRGNPKLAQKLARAAFMMAPNSKQAYIAWFHVLGSVPRPQMKNFPRLDQ